MPRYFFDTDDGKHCMRDDEGYEFPNSQDACDAAIRLLTDLARDLAPDGLRRGFITTVRDASKRLVVKVTLSVRTEWLTSPGDLSVSQHLPPTVVPDSEDGVQRLSG